MIIGRALESVLGGITIQVGSSTKNVAYNYGNQDMLNKFIQEGIKRLSSTMPLVFYVVKEFKRINNYRYCDTELWVFADTKEPFLAKKRTDDVYKRIIEPIYNKIIEQVEVSNGVTLLVDDKRDRFSAIDLPNCGISNNEIVSQITDKSVASRYLDARKIKFNIEVQIKCLESN